MKIFVIDDEAEIGEILQYLLQKKGHQVKSFDCPQKALEEILLSPPEFIVCDFQMPKMNGLELFEKIKSIVTIPFIILTGETSIAPEELKKAGIKEVLFKPKELMRVAILAQEHENSLS